MLVAVTLLVAAVPVKAQNALPRLQKAMAGGFVDARMPLAAQPTADASLENSPSTVRQTVEQMLQESGLTYKGVPAYTPRKEQGQTLTFIGMCQVAFTDATTFYTPYGLYKFSTANGLKRELLADVEACINLGGVYVGNTLHGWSSIPIPPINIDGKYRYYEWDTDTWMPNEKKNGTVSSHLSGQKAYDPVTKKVYGFIDSQDMDSRYKFVTVNFEDLSYEEICGTDSAARCFAINPEGEAYVLTRTSHLNKIDLSTGKMTVVGKLDIQTYFALESMTFDERTGKLYLCISSGSEKTGITSGIYEVSTADATTSLVGYLPEAEEYTCLKVVYTPAEGCPADISDLALAFSGSSLDGQVTFTMPASDLAGNLLTGNIDYTISIDDVEVKTGRAAAGQKVSHDVSVSEEGQHKVVVVLTNSVGEGSRNAAMGYAGEDTPMVHDLTFVFDAVTQKATVSWTAQAGQHGGYVDVANQTFRVVRYPDGIEVATAMTDCSFEQKVTEVSYAGYSYEVTAVVGDVEGTPARTNVIRFGSAIELPYVENIDAESDIDNFEIIDSNADGDTWTTFPIEEYSGEMNYRLYYYRTKSNTNSADDWVILRPVHLKSGYAYQLEFLASGTSARYQETISVAYGIGIDPTTYTELMPPTVLTGGIRDMQTITLDLRVDEEGDYQFAIHALSDGAQNAIFVDQIRFTEMASLYAPASAAALAAVAGDEGELTATIDFDTPDTNYDGGVLESITKVEVLRGEGEQQEVALTVEDVTPGQHVTVVDEDATNGFTTYTVIVYNDFGKSVPVSTTIYIGEDAPFAPRNVSVVDNLDGTATLVWDAPETTGQNGGYVHTDELLYNAYTLNSTDGAVPVGSDLEACSFIIENVEQPDYQSLKYYGVDAYNELGTSEMVQTRMVIGQPHQLPFMEGFKAGELTELWYYDASEAGDGFNMYSGLSYDGDNFVAAYQTKNTGSTSTLNTGKISIENAQQPKLVFAYLEMPGADNMLRVLVRKNGQGDSDVLFSHDFSEAGGSQQWKLVSIDLDEYTDAKYLSFGFEATVGDAEYNAVIIDDVNVRDVQTNDLATAISAQRHTQAGDAAKITATVHNVGSATATNYTVDLYIDGLKVASQAGRQVGSFSRVTYEFSYQTRRSDPEVCGVAVEAVYEPDENTADNLSDEVFLQIASPLLNTVADLVATDTDEGVNLGWSGVSTDNKFTESFEGYDTFLTEGFGNWKVYDGDASQNNAISGLNYQHMNDAYAWMTFDFESAGVDLNEYPAYVGNTGTQFVASMRPTTGTANDWLISPELSGEAQTITFYARRISGFMPDQLEVLYSTTGDGYADFTESLGSASISDAAFAQFAYELPAGAKYFALHNKSFYGGFLNVDDIYYEGRPLTLNGYNVYRDGELVAFVDDDATSFVDSSANDGNHVYNITAVFEEGESGFSNDAEVCVVTAISETVGGKASGSQYYDLQGRRLNKVQRGVTIVRDEAVTRKTIRK